jgi:hypothetical protein
LSKLKSCGHLRAGAEADEVAASTDDDWVELDEAGKVASENPRADSQSVCGFVRG